MLFSQRDERWAEIPLGLYGGHTIGSAGCMLSVCAGIVPDTDPGRLNRYLARNGGFAKGNLIIFSTIADLLGTSCEVVECEKIPAPVDRVIETLASDGYALAKVDFVPGGTIQQHWVRILEIDEKEAVISDPWLVGDTRYYMMARYGLPFWMGPARAIFRLVLFENDSQKSRMMEKQERLSVLWDWRR